MINKLLLSIIKELRKLDKPNKQLSTITFTDYNYKTNEEICEEYLNRTKNTGNKYF